MTDHITQLLQETARLEHEFSALQQQLTGNEWFEVIKRDLEASQLRMQNELREYIRHARQIIAERS